MEFLTVMFGLLTFAGLGFTIHYGRKASALEKARKQFDWTDLQACMSDLASASKKEFIPDVVFTPGLRGATLTNLLLSEFDGNIPAYVGISFWRESLDAPSELSETERIDTKKWYVHVPLSLTSYKDKKLLVVDDFAMSGDFLDSLRIVLQGMGFQSNNVKTMCAVTTTIAIQNKKAPDYWWFASENTDFYFPWGKAR